MPPTSVRMKGATLWKFAATVGDQYVRATSSVVLPCQ